MKHYDCFYRQNVTWTRTVNSTASYARTVTRKEFPDNLQDNIFVMVSKEKVKIKLKKSEKIYYVMVKDLSSNTWRKKLDFLDGK